MQPFDATDRQAITALRILAVDQVEQARSGHPGMPLGAAPMAYVLWSRFLRHDPRDPAWPDRDRFVLSAGHGSALLYALLHLFGYDVSLDELKRFRQLDSRTPGHPERGVTPGVEITTGPLGQGFGAAVGMAIAERHLAARFNHEGFPLVNHRTFVIASDGDLMEGISHEAASLAGHLRLGRLVVLWDDNRITIDGPTSLAWSEDVPGRFRAYGWRVIEVEDGEDLQALADALAAAVANEDGPALVRVRTHIGYGSPAKQDTAAAHGAPLGAQEAAATRKALGWEIEEPFAVPQVVRDHYHRLAERSRRVAKEWRKLRTEHEKTHPAEAGELARRLAGELPEELTTALPRFEGTPSLATREASGVVLNAFAPLLPELVGGSADLSGSNNTIIKGEMDFQANERSGRGLRFGVREHAMAAIAGGMALHGALRPYVATFLVFSDYLRPALRLAALMKLPVVYVFTHDSIAVGEDGPTHQPVEHLAALRAIPGLTVLRPADAHETAQAWHAALQRRDGPTALILTRQKLPVLPPPPADAVARGAYVIRQPVSGCSDAVLLASGSEVALALATAELLAKEGIDARVVSVPCLESLSRLDPDSRHAVLGSGCACRVVIEMGRGMGWERHVPGAELVTLERFGASAPGEELAAHLGFSPEKVAERVRAALSARRPSKLIATLPPTMEGVLAGRVARLETLHVLQRIRIHDATLWGESHARDVARRLGWLDLPGRACQELFGLGKLVGALAAEGAKTLYLLGMGGSSLAPRVLRELLGNPSHRRLVVVDTTDPDLVAGELDTLDPRSSAVVAVSKSGTTAETSALLEIFWERFQSALRDGTGARFVSITEHGTPLERLAQERGFRDLIPHPVDVGGRYSALSAVGLLPAVWLGHDIEQLVSGAARALCGLSPTHPAVELGLIAASSAPNGWGKLAWCSSPTLLPLGAWAEQLIAESTGKQGKGLLPLVADLPPSPETAWGATLYFSPRLVGEETAEIDSRLDALAAAGHPVARWCLPRTALGEAFAVLEMATAVAALLLGVNPFDEPDVVRAKEKARAILAEPSLTLPERSVEPARQLIDHLAGLHAEDALVLLAYLPERPDTSLALAELAARLSARGGVPSTYAFGPRYLHSTGQLHKGGPNHTVPIVLTGKSQRDLTIPRQRFTLGQLRWAQALGDIEALEDAGRRVLHLHLEGDPLEALGGLTQEL